MANPVESRFTRDVIAGDNLQVADFFDLTSPQSKYLQQLFNDGRQLKDFGALVAPLGVQYVILAKTTDWSSYEWLTHQSDLRLVMDTKSLEVWQNRNYQGVGGRYRNVQSVSSVRALEAIAAGAHLPARAVRTFEDLIDGRYRGAAKRRRHTGLPHRVRRRARSSRLGRA